ncbi:MAG: CRISPR-associated protein Cas5 [Akkermansia sp.]
MSLVCFELSGDMALWRNFQESMGAYSCLGPAPSNIAGLIGAALGFASPYSQGVAPQAIHTKLTATEKKKKDQLPWPISPELLIWEKANDLHVACRWIGGIPRREAWNVKGIKAIKEGDTLRMQQQVIMSPHYEIVIQLPEHEVKAVINALKTPAFPLYLGSSFCRAIIRNIRICPQFPNENNWAHHLTGAALGEATPFSRHRVDADTSYERIRRDGYWIYPTPEQPGINTPHPLVRAWCSADHEEI